MPSPSSHFRSLRALTATAAALTIPLAAFGASANNSKAELRQALVADYQLTQVGQVMLKTDYNRITKPGTILAVRVPGIYADMANTQNDIVNTNVLDGQVTQASGFFAATGGSTANSRTLKPDENTHGKDSCWIVTLHS
jgi:hypothetical protein